MELEPGSLQNKYYAVNYDLGNIGTRTSIHDSLHVDSGWI